MSLILVCVIVVLPKDLYGPREQREWVNYFPEPAKTVMRTYLSIPREWADVRPEKANHVPALGQHFRRPHQQGKSDADHCEGQKRGPDIRDHRGALLPGREMQEKQWEDRDMGK